MIAYSMVKAGLEMMTKSLALELAPLGIRVNAVAPSLAPTNLHLYCGMNELEVDALRTRAAKNTPMARNATINEVAKAIIFLSSEQ